MLALPKSIEVSHDLLSTMRGQLQVATTMDSYCVDLLRKVNKKREQLEYAQLFSLKCILLDYLFTIKFLPVISAGISKPIAVSIVGAMSQSAPSLS